MSTFRVLYNACYGGFNVSEEALAAYAAISEKPADSAYCIGDDIESRSDPVWLGIFDSLGGQRFSGPCARIRTAEFDEKYRGYLSISEYDGAESVHRHEFTYLTHSILKSTLSDADKVAELKKLNKIEN